MTDWIDRNAYPFNPNYFKLPCGKMHYVDEGKSDHVVVMVHGNPAWSFYFREIITCLSRSFRCIAPDHIGFGLSDKPFDWDYYPESHSDNFRTFLDQIDTDSITLIVQDWGGPIGLSYAIKYPEKVKSLVIMNTWMWSVKGASL